MWKWMLRKDRNECRDGCTTRAWRGLDLPVCALKVCAYRIRAGPDLRPRFGSVAYILGCGSVCTMDVVPT